MKEITIKGEWSSLVMRESKKGFTITHFSQIQGEMSGEKWFFHGDCPEIAEGIYSSWDNRIDYKCLNKGVKVQ